MGGRPFLKEEMVCARSGQPKKGLLCWEWGGGNLSDIGREGTWEGVMEEEGNYKPEPDPKRSYVSKQISYVQLQNFHSFLEDMDSKLRFLNGSFHFRDS